MRPKIRPLAALLLLGGGTIVTAATPAPPPGIAVIIDDLGHSLSQARRVIALPGAVACAVLPHTPYARVLAREAYGRGKEVILHLPMESADAAPPGPGALDSEMSDAQIVSAVAAALESVPHASGVSNHMGSLLTERTVSMRSLMATLARWQDLLFVDSRTSAHSVAADTAAERGIPHLRRDVFLDSDRNPQAIAQQFARLLEIARARGGAVAIGHPYPETLALLEGELPRLPESGVTLVSLRELIATGRAGYPSYARRRVPIEPAPSGIRTVY